MITLIFTIFIMLLLTFFAVLIGMIIYLIIVLIKSLTEEGILFEEDPEQQPTQNKIPW